MKKFQKRASPTRKQAKSGCCTLVGPSRCKAPAPACCLSRPPESTSSTSSKCTFPRSKQPTIQQSMKVCLPVSGSRQNLGQEAHCQGRLAARRPPSEQRLSESVDG